jgi:hypothetical protein
MISVANPPPHGEFIHLRKGGGHCPADTWVFYLPVVSSELVMSQLGRWLLQPEAFVRRQQPGAMRLIWNSEIFYWCVGFTRKDTCRNRLWKGSALCTQSHSTYTGLGLEASLTPSGNTATRESLHWSKVYHHCRHICNLQRMSESDIP